MPAVLIGFAGGFSTSFPSVAAIVPDTAVPGGTTFTNTFIGVRDLVARGYFIPWGASQKGGGQAPMFPCRTLSDLDYPGLKSVTCDVSSRWVLALVQ